MRSLSCAVFLGLLSIPVLAAPPQPTLDLRSGALDVREPAPRGLGPDPSIRVVRFDGPPTAQQLDALGAATDRVFTYLPHHAFLVRIREADGGRQASDLSSFGVVWSAPWAAERKIAPEIASAGIAERSSARGPVMIHLFPDVALRDVRERIARIVGDDRVVGSSENRRFSRVRVLLTGSEIADVRGALAALPEVYWIERERRKVFLNDTSTWVGQSGLDGGQATPVFDAGIRGEGEIVAFLDTGVDADSCYFRDTVRGLPPINACGGTTVDLDQRKVIAVDFLWSGDCSGGIDDDEWDDHGHGTHVGGSIAGDDFASPGVHNASDGMAPAAKLVVQDCGYQFNDCADCPGIGCPVTDLGPVFQQTYDQGARIHSNSWGDEENDPAYGEYTSGSEDADTFARNNPDFLLLFAAGNNGGIFNTVDSPSTAKNAISVGATQHAAFAGTIASFSSRGPTDDGRIKPDLTAPGENISSAATDEDVTTNNCNAVPNSGTSMATPTLAGYAALVRQYLRDGFYPTGVATPGDAIEPSSALVKALLINSGTPMSNEGDIPNDTQGWGRVLLDDALHFDGDDRDLWLVDEASGFDRGAGQNPMRYPIVVDADTEALEVTLVWTDAPSTPVAVTNLVNDLDLRVVGPDGAFRGNVFGAGASVEGGSADRLNNVEVVLVESPTPGSWVLEVAPWSIPEGTQPFALVATGALSNCGGEADAVAMAPETPSVFGSGDGDEFLDNCESADLGVWLVNTGGADAADVEITATSPSHSGSVFAAPGPSLPSLPSCSVVEAQAPALIGAAGLGFGDDFEIELEVSRSGTAITRTTSFTIPQTETDLFLEDFTWDFETDLEGWTVTSGTFVRSDTLDGAEGSDWYLQSSANAGNRCDVVRSPDLRWTPTSTLSLWNRYAIEGQSSGSWYDRANVGLVRDGIRTVVEPDGGRPYDVADGESNGTCGTDEDAGWADTSDTWAESTWSASALGGESESAALEIRYGTDGGLHLDGFRFDRVTATDVGTLVPDAQNDGCVPGEIFADGFESGDTTAWTG